MASTTNDSMASSNELALAAIREQITIKLRVLRPNVKNPLITSLFDRDDDAHNEVKGTWAAAVWNEQKLIYSTYAGAPDALAAMRKLLLLISVEVKIMAGDCDVEYAKNYIHALFGIEYK